MIQKLYDFLTKIIPRIDDFSSHPTQKDNGAYKLLTLNSFHNECEMIYDFLKSSVKDSEKLLMKELHRFCCWFDWSIEEIKPMLMKQVNEWDLDHLAVHLQIRSNSYTYVLSELEKYQKILEEAENFFGFQFRSCSEKTRYENYQKYTDKNHHTPIIITDINKSPNINVNVVKVFRNFTEHFLILTDLKQEQYQDIAAQRGLLVDCNVNTKRDGSHKIDDQSARELKEYLLFFFRVMCGAHQISFIIENWESMTNGKHRFLYSEPIARNGVLVESDQDEEEEEEDAMRSIFASLKPPGLKRGLSNSIYLPRLFNQKDEEKMIEEEENPIQKIFQANFQLWKCIPRERPLNSDQHRQKFFQIQAKIKQVLVEVFNPGSLTEMSDQERFEKLEKLGQKIEF